MIYFNTCQAIHYPSNVNNFNEVKNDTKFIFLYVINLNFETKSITFFKTSNIKYTIQMYCVVINNTTQ